MSLPIQHSDCNTQSSPSSRRNFLKTATAASAVTSAATGVTASFLQRSVHAQGTDIIKVGLVGAGGRGTGAAKDAMDADSGCRLTAIAEITDDRLDGAKKNLKRSLGDKFAVPDEQCFSGWDAMQRLLETDINVVLLATPPGFRPMQMEAAVAAGKHVFCEKPVAVDPVGVRRVMAASEAAKAKGLSVVSGLCWRYDYGVKATIDKILNGAIGELISIQENYLAGTLWIREPKDWWSPMHNQVMNWLYYRWLSGDHIVEQFIHSLDKSLWLHNDTPPVQCYGLGGRQVRTEPEYGDIYDHFYVVYQWADGTRTYAATRQMPGCFNETEDYVFGTKGTARVLANEITGENPWKFTGEKPSMYYLEHVALMQSIREGTPINNGDYMCKSTLMAIMGREAAYSGEVIRWDDIKDSKLSLVPDTLAWGNAPPVDIHQPGSYSFNQRG
jgi:myo-inositol 2-dehydrogenase/D-chiro-inositol 1-dehydrogenase